MAATATVPSRFTILISLLLATQQGYVACRAQYCARSNELTIALELPFRLNRSGSSRFSLSRVFLTRTGAHPGASPGQAFARKRSDDVLPQNKRRPHRKRLLRFQAVRFAGAKLANEHHSE